MKVQQLFLRNVRSIKNLDLDFRDPVTRKPLSRIVLAGANGSGKTTILESLYGLLAAAEKYGKGAIDYYSQLRDVAIPLTAEIQLRVLFEVKLPNSLPIVLSVSYGDKEISVTEISISEAASVGGHRPSLGDKQVQWLENLKNASLFKQLASSVRSASERQGETIGSILYFPHNRHLPSVPQGELGFEPKAYQWAYKYQASDEWKGSTESYLFSLNYLDLEDRDRKFPANRFSQTVAVVNAVLVGKQIARIEKGRVVIETDGGQTHSLDDLSSGEKQLVLLLIEITRRVVPGSVILIDEPEISLHPTWQRGLMAALDKIIEQYEAQVILATHSLEVATSVMPEEVISLSDLGLPRGKWEPEREALA